VDVSISYETEVPDDPECYEGAATPEGRMGKEREYIEEGGDYLISELNSVHSVIKATVTQIEHGSPDVMAADEMLSHYSAALDEIYRLRRALAFEARVVEAHLGLKSFPKSRRRFAEEQVERMRESARGHAERVYAGRDYWKLDEALRSAGAGFLTRHQWEHRNDEDAA
jgi:hypothetical protein